MSKTEITMERVLISALIGAVIGVVALMANEYIPKALNGRGE